MSLRRIRFNAPVNSDPRTLGHGIQTGSLVKATEEVKSGFVKASLPLRQMKVGASGVMNSERRAAASQKQLELFKQLTKNEQQILNNQVKTMEEAEKHLSALEASARKVQEIQGQRMVNSHEHNFAVGLNQSRVQGTVEVMQDASSFDNL